MVYLAERDSSVSNILPQSVVDAIRTQNDVAVDIVGIDCTLHIPNNKDTVDNNTIYTIPADFTYTVYRTKVFILWGPNKHQLRKLGIMTEEDVPILAAFSNRIEDAAGFAADIQIPRNSWFSISIQFVPREMDTEEFEVVDLVVPSMHDASTVHFYKIAPRRAK